ncbi:amidase [Amaricoccus solimangrovi]|uniref:Amidase n=1 Tax=Amaricoccus solimangrovi TaxID=2589815 RepID=A0A501WWM0_9RHOB|nr:amidase family protein [Amaricoccus solimangrovi]TPE53122.1 amidase [Amaricoccus solimangrovi]
MSETWLWMGAAALGREIEAGAIDPRELAEVYLGAIESHPQAPAIYARPTPERAREEASAAAERARAGLRRGPLDGVPVSWKDLFDSAGVATESGSALLAGRVPERDAEVLARATRAGLVCLGKTHQTELAFSGLGLNPSTATPPNINDPELAPGGSSSGAATSVAFGLAAAGIGSDTGGSVRVPAAWNDLVGLKTTHGLLPLTGVVPLCPRFDTVGPLCRSVEDAALLLGILGAAPAPDLAGATLDGRRFLVLEHEALGSRPEPAAAFEAAVAALERAGASVARGAPDAAIDCLNLAPVLFASEAYASWGEAIEDAPDLIFAPVRERFRGGAAFSAVDYIRGWSRLGDYREAYLAATAAFDAVLLPTTANMPPNTERLLADPEHFATENLLTLRNTRVGNLLGLCALTLPTATPSAGLMMMAPPGAEAALSRLGAAAERALR